MLILLMLMGPIHPPTADDEEPLGIGGYHSRLADLGVHLRRLHADAVADFAVDNWSPLPPGEG